MTDVPNWVTDPPAVIWTADDDGAPLSIQFAMLDDRLVEDLPKAGATRARRLVRRQWKVETVWSTDTGRLEPVSVKVEGAGNVPVVADVLRRLPIGTMQQAARREGARMSERIKAARPDLRPDDAELLDKIGRGHRGVVTTPEEIAEVERVYLKAWKEGEPVTEAVAKEFGISKSTAGKRIMKARRAGLLATVPRTGPR
jgi:hypothetical protein